MSEDTERVAIATRVAPLLTGIPIKWPNQKFLEPSSGPFCHVLILPIRDVRETLGRERYLRRCHSQLQIDLYAREDTGTKFFSDTTESLKLNLSDAQFKTSDDELLTFMQADVRPYSVQNGIVRRAVIFPFYRDQYATVPL